LPRRGEMVVAGVAEVTERSMVALRDRGLRADRESSRDRDP
jgi:hypothetical protein